MIHWFFFLSVCFFNLATPHGTWDLNSPTRDKIHVPSIESAESSPLDCQGSPYIGFYKFYCLFPPHNDSCSMDDHIKILVHSFPIAKTEALSLSPFQRWGNWAQRSCHRLEATQLGKSCSRIQRKLSSGSSHHPRPPLRLLLYSHTIDK